MERMKKPRKRFGTTAMEHPWEDGAPASWLSAATAWRPQHWHAALLAHLATLRATPETPLNRRCLLRACTTWAETMHRLGIPPDLVQGLFQGVAARPETRLPREEVARLLVAAQVRQHHGFPHPARGGARVFVRAHRRGGCCATGIATGFTVLRLGACLLQLLDNGARDVRSRPIGLALGHARQLAYDRGQRDRRRAPAR